MHGFLLGQCFSTVSGLEHCNQFLTLTKKLTKFKLVD